MSQTLCEPWELNTVALTHLSLNSALQELNRLEQLKASPVHFKPSSTILGTDP